MHAGHRAVVGIAGMLLVGGCRTATRVAEVPRVDLELEGGNRGYLLGRPPESAEMNTTRQMLETQVEIPSFARPKRAGASPPPVVAPPPLETEEEPAGLSAEPSSHDTYVVKQGDSLWSIAAKPEVYGKATRWRRLFDANRETLQTPDALKPGMTLKIPRAAGQGTEGGVEGEGGTSFKK